MLSSQLTNSWSIIWLLFLFISVKIEEKCPREPQIDRSVNQTLMIEDWRPTVRLLKTLVLVCLDQSEFRLIIHYKLTGRPMIGELLRSNLGQMVWPWTGHSFHVIGHLPNCPSSDDPCDRPLSATIQTFSPKAPYQLWTLLGRSDSNVPNYILELLELKSPDNGLSVLLWFLFELYNDTFRPIGSNHWMATNWLPIGYWNFQGQGCPDY